MSYDLGYEIGYEGQDNQSSLRVRLEDKQDASAEPVLTPYRMNGVSGPPIDDFVAKYMPPSTTQGPLPQPAPSSNAITATRSGPTGVKAAQELESMGGTPANPGARPAASVDMPAVSHDALEKEHASEEWKGVRSELRDYYGFNPSEIDAFENQYRNLSPAQLRAGNPPILPAHNGTDTHKFTDLKSTDAERKQRTGAASDIRRRVADDMVHDTGAQIYGMFPPNEISRETADAMAAHLYRGAGADPDANPPDIAALYRARETPKDGGPSPVGRRLNDLRGSSIQPPDPKNPSSGLHASDTPVQSLLKEAQGFYQPRAVERVAPLLANVPGAGTYYANSGKGPTHRSADANLYVANPNHVDSNPGLGVGQMREIARTPRPKAKGETDTLQSRVNSFAQSLGQPAQGQPPNEFRRGLEGKMANPAQMPDMSGWSPKERREFESNMAMKRFDADLQAKTQKERDAEGEQMKIREEGRQQKMKIEDERRQQEFQLRNMYAQNELQQKSQFDNAMLQFGLQTAGKLGDQAFKVADTMAQATIQMAQNSTPRPWDIVSQMLGGGMGARGARAHA